MLVLLAPSILSSLVRCVPQAHAHEARPACLEIREVAPGLYAVLWRTPLLSGMRLPLALELPSGVRDVVEPAERVLSDSVVSGWCLRGRGRVL